MSVIEDTRKLIQDFLAPELREISVRLDSLEERLEVKMDSHQARNADRFTAIEKQFQTIDKRFDAVDKRFDAVDKRFDTAERLAADRHTQLLQQLQQINDVNELKIRIARIEAQKIAS